MINSNSTTQWSNLLKHLGAWQGSFTRLTPSGEVMEDTPTLVTLEGLNNNQTIRQTIERFPANLEPPSPTVLEYSNLNRSTLFFPNGAFSVGSMQFSPVAQFGAELGFIYQNRRLRIVPLFDKNSHLFNITLIREYLPNTVNQERPPLTIENLLGEWEGEAATIYPDWLSPDIYPTNLSITLAGEKLRQTLKTPQLQISSIAIIDGSILRFEEGETKVQVLLLPAGASCNTPVVIPRGRPFFLEAGWLLSEKERLRLIRSYDPQGSWTSLTLVTERKI